MTTNQSWPVEAFIAEVAKAHPRLRIECDTPEPATGSTYMNIRAGDDLIVVEHHPDRGFGFADEASDSRLYGTPSGIFLRGVDEALVHLEQMLAGSLTIGAGEAVRRGA